jgi:hypothetical protein
MAAPKTNAKRRGGRAQRQEHLTRVADLHMRGVEQRDIGKMLGRSQGQISKDVKVIEERWLESQLESMDKVKSRMSMKLNALFEEAWNAWAISNDPRHFANALTAMRDLRTLIGADAPKRSEVEQSGTLNVRHTVEDLTDAELDSIARGDFTVDDETGDATVSGKRIALPQVGT